MKLEMNLEFLQYIKRPIWQRAKKQLREKVQELNEIKNGRSNSIKDLLIRLKTPFNNTRNHSIPRSSKNSKSFILGEKAMFSKGRCLLVDGYCCKFSIRIIFSE